MGQHRGIAVDHAIRASAAAEDKHASALLTQEIEQKIPVPMNELAIASWMQRVQSAEEEIHGRPAVITAARQSVIDDRLQLFSDAGLTLTGLQADNTALANFIAYEFADVLSPAEDDRENPNSVMDDHKTPAIVVLDCGCATTNMVIVSAETHWCWTGESGGEDLTTALARVTKTTHSEAEKLKYNPAALETPQRHYQAVEQKQDELRVRVETVLNDALKQNKRFEIVQSWCLGGGCQAHQWIRRLMTAGAEKLD